LPHCLSIKRLQHPHRRQCPGDLTMRVADHAEPHAPLLAVPLMIVATLQRRCQPGRRGKPTRTKPPFPDHSSEVFATTTLTACNGGSPGHRHIPCLLALATRRDAFQGPCPLGLWKARGSRVI